MEKSEAARQEEQQRKALEAKAAAFEKQVLQLQVSPGSSISMPPFTPATKRRLRSRRGPGCPLPRCDCDSWELG